LLHLQVALTGSACSPDTPYTLFLHGGGATANSARTRYLRDALAERGFASVAIDFSGHGGSDGRLLDASLQQRRDEALCVVKHLRLRKPHAIVATSMSGHTACRLIDALDPRALILFAPAAYEARAETARFGETFRAVIRSTQNFSESPAFDDLRRFKGQLLTLYGNNDAVIPTAVKTGYRAAARNGEHIDISDAGHQLHDWLHTFPTDKNAVICRIASLLAMLA
jgi:pimeloyl-ACP methyl ester carboxylesterase